MASAALARFRQTQASYSCLADFLRPTPSAALRSSNNPGRDDLSHQVLHDFVRNFVLPIDNRGALRKPIVAVILPNGPILAATVLAVTNSYAAAPINPAAGPEQVAADIALSGASAVVTCRSEAEKLLLADLGLDLFYVDEPQSTGAAIQVHTPAGEPIALSSPTSDPNLGDDIGIILFTSGTSGKKKVVPMTTHSIVCGVEMVIESWALTEDDICLNMMPLYHVGGLIRNIFAPIHAGGSTVCCPGFDPNLFWDTMESVQPTWYYASPSMHSLILEESRNRPSALQKSKMRLICNAAGGLLPALAIQLRDTFGSTVLPSYGMTECMPISTPPIDYKLDRSGTSGISVGPDLTILDGRDGYAPVHQVGRICVRGEPVFRGYLQADGSLDKSPFNEEGWFDTGDMGYMDKDGYLYITGRNKEVINRGGELISPFEVENAIVSAAEREDSPIYGRVSQALSFSVQHEVLQEVVGVALVTPKGKPRVDARLLHEALRSTLQQVKWPVVIVYMNDVPKKNNKVLRIKLGERLGLPCINDDTPFSERHLEADCPPENTDLSVLIPSRHCEIDETQVHDAISHLVAPGMDMLVEKSPQLGTLEVFLAPLSPTGMSPSGSDSGTATPVSPMSADTARTLTDRLAGVIDGYLVPHKVMALTEPLPRTEKGSVDIEVLHQILQDMHDAEAQALSSSTEGRITQIFAEILGMDAAEIPADQDFFSLGGDSLRAGKLLSSLRIQFNLRLPIDLIFNDGSVERLADYINKELAALSDEDETAAADLPGLQKTCSSTNPLLLLVQLIPMAIVYPMRRAFQWTVFMYCLMYSQRLSTSETVPGRLLDLSISIYIARIAGKLVLPWFGIAAKWLLIGRHREGLYPMWGFYHTRWWLVQKITDVCGKGFFAYGNWLTVVYYRMMGAKIGSGVTLNNVSLGEWDLIEIGDNATLDGCHVRPFGAERNTTMYLGKIRIGTNASVGVASTVAPGTTVPDNTCIGPNSSSWELSDATEANRDLSATKAVGSHWLLTIFGTLPLLIIAKLIYLVPWFLALIGLVQEPAIPYRSAMVTIIEWFAQGERVGWYYLARALRTFFGPFFIFAFVIVLKWTLDLFCGPLRPGPAESMSQMTKWRMSLMKTLMPIPQLHEMTGLFGQHYEATSIALRALGAKAGKRVYWPGTGPSIGDYHLIDVGNDVVFGSRSHLITSDAQGSAPVTIGDRAMIADRVVALPGVTIENMTTMGSGALTRRDKTYESGATYVGSKGGDSVSLGGGASRHAGPMMEKSTSTGTMPTVTVGSADSDSSSDIEKDITAVASVDGDATPMSRDQTIVAPTPRKDIGLRRAAFAGASAAATRPPSAGNQDDDPNTLISPSPDLEKGRLSMSQPVEGSALSRKLAKVPTETRVREMAKEDGDASSESESEDAASSTSPFGRAFYHHLAPYYVLRQWQIFGYASFFTVLTEVYWNFTSLSSLQAVALVYREVEWLGNGEWWNCFILYGIVTGLIAIIVVLQVIVCLLFVIGAKWALIGRRQPGNYDWDKSSYCQRWQLFLTIEKIRRRAFAGTGCLGMLTGTAYLTWYFRAMGATIGKDCALFVNGSPSLMFTEPDLLTLGDRVTVDDASLVGHINSRGKFDLNRLSVGSRSVLRSNSRLLSGANMGEDSCLLEHTLVMGGDVVGAGETMQGWPASKFRAQRVNL